MARRLPALSDPVEIINAGLASTEGARTVHLEVTVGGELNIAIPGGSGPPTTIKLGGTNASADIDLAGGKGRATFAAPGLLILSGEAIQIGETSYIRTSLGGPLFEVVEATDALPVDPTDASGIFDDVGDFLLADGVDPVKGDDVDCAGKSCYTVTIDLTADELAALGGSAPIPDGLPDLPVDLGGANLALTVRVEKDTHRLAGIGIGRLARRHGLGDHGCPGVEVGSTDGHLASARRSDQARDVDVGPPRMGTPTYN